MFKIDKKVLKAIKLETKGHGLEGKMKKWWDLVIIYKWMNSPF